MEFAKDDDLMDLGQNPFADLAHLPNFGETTEQIPPTAGGQLSLARSSETPPPTPSALR